MKKYFEVSTKTIVATGLGAAIFTLLFMYVKIPSPVPKRVSKQPMVSSSLQLYLGQLPVA